MVKVIEVDYAAMELKIAEDFGKEPVGCPHCHSEKVEWAEIMNGTFWKQCGACGMVYVGHDTDQKEIDG